MSRASAAEQFLQRLAGGGLPPQVRLAAAAGALPLPPADLLRIQAFLARRDGDAEVRRRAAEALRARPASETAALVRGEGLSPELAEFLAEAPDAPLPVLEALIGNPVCPDEVLIQLAAAASPALVDVLLLNQVRLGGSAAIVTALEANPALTGGQRSKLGEIRRHFLDAAPAAPAPAPPDEDLSPAEADLLAEAMREAEEEAARAAGATAASEPEPDAGDREGPGISAYQRILKLTPSEKVKLAFTGGAEDRAILIRDGNRVVCRTVLKSPRITDKEVETFVNMRSLSDEVMRAIAANREWLKSYTVVIGLIRNPKTPAAISMNLLSRLKQRDLNSMAGDRNVPEVVRRQARKNFLSRTQGK